MEPELLTEPERIIPRLVNLDRPEATVHTTLADRHRFSQRNVDVLDCRENAARTVPATQMLESLPHGMWKR